jgi:hypothetical protein
VPNSLYTETTYCERFLTGAGNDGFATANVTFTYAGIAVTAEEETLTASTIPVQTTSRNLPADLAAKSYTGIVYAPVVTLVHTGSENAESRAVTVGVVKLVAVWTIAALVGATLMVSI